MSSDLLECLASLPSLVSCLDANRASRDRAYDRKNRGVSLFLSGKSYVDIDLYELKGIDSI